MTQEEQDQLFNAAANAAAMLGAIYQHADHVKACGGTTCLSGIAAATAMMASIEKNRERADKLIMAPLRAALEKRETKE